MRLAHAAKATDLSASKRQAMYHALGDEFVDAFEQLLRDRVSDAQNYASAEAYNIINLMLPKGVPPPAEQQEPYDYWGLTVAGAKPRERLARVRVKVKRAMNAVSVREVREALAPKLPTAFRQRGIGPLVGLENSMTQQFDSVLSIVTSMAANDTWLSGQIAAAAQYQENVDVLSHYEVVAVDDELTCEVCAAGNGEKIDTDVLGAPIDVGESIENVDRHPNCRCIAVPVSKTWEELGFKGIEEPEGTRIQRTAEEGVTAAPTKYVDDETGREYKTWAPGRSPAGGSQRVVKPSEPFLVQTEGER